MKPIACWAGALCDNSDMLLPRFTLRTGLIVLTAAALVSLVFREAWVGTPWAVGAVIGLGSLAALFAVHAAFFAAAIALSRPRRSAPVDTESAGGRAR